MICSDKTGTLTQNRMTLTKVWVDGAGQPEDVGSHNSPEAKNLLLCGALCCDGSVVFGDDGTEQHLGDPTETAILVAAHKNGLEQEQLRQAYPRVAEIPFDSDRKLMTSVHRMDGKIVVIVKGAFDVMASRCVRGDLQAAKVHNEQMSTAALRVLAVGYKTVEAVPEPPTPQALGKRADLPGPGRDDRSAPPGGQGRRRHLPQGGHPAGDDHRRPRRHRLGHREGAWNHGGGRPAP